MANSNEEQPKSASPAEDKKLEAPKPVVKTASTKPFLFVFTSLIALLALTLALFAIYINQHAQQAKAQQTEDLKLAVAELEEQQKTNETRVDSLKTTVNESQTALQNKMQALDKNLQTAAQQRPYQQQDWILLKARYFLELAQINAHWAKDRQTTIALLQQADGLIATMSDPQFFALRQAIAKDISQLQALPQIDLPGLLSQLDAAQSALANLPFKQAKLSDTKAKAAETNKSWQENLKNSLGNLEKLVVIRHNDEAAQKLLSPFAQTLMKDSVYLNLQEAQWALMQSSQPVYHLALKRALETIQRIFDNQAVPTQALIKQLQQLQQENLQTQSAIPENSLTLLNQLIEKNNAKPSPNLTPPKGGNAP